MVIRLNENDIKKMVEASVKRILNEGTDILYHFTNLPGLMEIVRTNSFKLTDNRKTSESGNVMSFSRTKHNPYMYCLTNYLGDDWYVRLTIDGRKLNQKYKTYPINDLYTYPEWVRDMLNKKSVQYDKYFKPIFGKNHWIPKDTPSQKLTDFEYEDRLVSDLKRVPDAMSFVTRIDIYPEDITYPRKTKRFVKDLFDKFGDIVHVYKDLGSFRLQKQSGEISEEDLYKLITG